MPSLAFANRGKAVLAAVCLMGLLACPSVGADEKLDLDAWRRMPVFARGRLQPMDSYARDTVEAICGRPSPTLVLPASFAEDFSRQEQETILAHELAHLAEMNHSPAFWRVVESVCPDYRQCRTELHGYGIAE